MPYAAKAVIQHEYEDTSLYIWITFCLPMKLSSNPLAEPVIFDVKPPNSKWLIKLDAVETAITSSEWLDLYTMLLTITTIDVSPDKVTVAYDGPDIGLRTAWNKQWEPWAAIESVTGYPFTRHNYFVNRGDPITIDYDKTTLIADDDWHDLDLSDIVPVGVSAVLFRAYIRSGGIGDYFHLRKRGNENNVAIPGFRTQVEGNYNDQALICAVDDERFIQYLASPVAWTDLTLIILGWFY
jgi:hypothetical protein